LNSLDLTIEVYLYLMTDECGSNHRIHESTSNGLHE